MHVIALALVFVEPNLMRVKEVESMCKRRLNGRRRSHKLDAISPNLIRLDVARMVRRHFPPPNLIIDVARMSSTPFSPRTRSDRRHTHTVRRHLPRFPP